MPLIDVGDGSGDKLLQLPTELLDALGWTVEDELELFPQESSELRLRRAKPGRS